MVGKFRFNVKFSDLDINDAFFDSLKDDYPEFPQWYQKKASEGATTFVFCDDEGLGAFMYLKSEDEPIELEKHILPAISRKKIGTLKLADRYQGQRLGEGALGIALWNWRKTKEEEIYVTVFEKHTLLVKLLERYGFCLAGYKKNGECVYSKSRINVDYSDPYKSFPFINPVFNSSGYLLIDDIYHDTLFPYSELKNTHQESVALSVANGFTKIYVGSPTSAYPYRVGDPILICRKYTGDVGQPGFKSCVTSYCVITDIIVIKEKNKYRMPFDELLGRIRNKSVFDEQELKSKYDNERNLTIVEMLYYGYFGAGNNVNWVWLKENNFWGDGYPTTKELTQDQFKAILTEGRVDVQNIIID